MDPAILDAIASPRRREILRLVWDKEQTAGEIHRAMPDVTFGAVSLQLRALVKAGLLDVRAQQRNRFYRTRCDALGPVAKYLSECGTTRCGSSSWLPNWNKRAEDPNLGATNNDIQEDLCRNCHTAWTERL